MVVDNKVIDRTMNSSNVQVVVRLRPLNSKEKKHGTLPVVSASTADKSVTVIKGSGSRQARSSYTFDNVFTAFSTQEEVFDATLKPVLSDVLKGFESTGKENERRQGIGYCYGIDSRHVLFFQSEPPSHTFSSKYIHPKQSLPMVRREPGKLIPWRETLMIPISKE